ncbi:MAG: hypothetical protein DMG07_25040, partial [Acidobacteria bacterium]
MKIIVASVVLLWSGAAASAAGTVAVHSGARAEVSEAAFFAFDLDTIPFRRNLDLTLVPATKHPGPVLRRGPRGAFDELRAEYFGTVLKIDGKFRMWYVGYGFEDPDNRTYAGASAHVGYAESEDGIRWVKPNLGLVDYHGNKNNNIVLLQPRDYTSATADRNLHVLYEPDDPMLWVPHEGGRWSMVPVLSADGLRWRFARPMQVTEGVKPRFTLPSIPLPNEHLEGGGLVRVAGIYYQNGQAHNPHNGTSTGRIPATYWSPDFIHWNHEKAVSFVRSGFDYRTPAGEGREVHEGAALWNRGNTLVGLYGIWEGAKNWADRRIHFGLVTTTDAIHFREPQPEFVFAAAGKPGEWDAGGLLQGQGFEQVGDRTYIWYGTWNLTTSGGPQVDVAADLLASHGDVGLMMLRRDGFGYVSVLDPKELKRMETYGDGIGSLLTVPFRVAGGNAAVAVNAELGTGGRLTLELLDGNGRPLDGYAAADFVRPEHGGVKVPVRWKSRGTIPEGVYRIRVKLER